jgi:hypothetical protein
MKVLLLEVRDSMTTIPCVAMQCRSDDSTERWMLQRAGYMQGAEACGHYCVLFSTLYGDRILTYEAGDWASQKLGRTMEVAHNYVREHFDELRTGDVIDVEFILGEKPTKKLPERLS